MAKLILNLQHFSGEKTEKATPKKREETRKKGQVAKSQDINTAVILLAVFGFLWAGKGFFTKGILAFFTDSFQHRLLTDLSIGNIGSVLSGALLTFLMIMAPIFAIAFVAGVASNLAQVGFMFTTESLQFKLDRIDPIQGFKRIYSLRALVELFKSILKIVVIGSVAIAIIWMNKEKFLSLPLTSHLVSITTMYDLMVQVGFWSSLALLILSVFDFAYQKYDFEKNIRMSKQDIKDEYKKSEGDPLIKSKIKQKQREIAMRRMMQEVPNADVVITNPTHFAIALKYDENKKDAPYVVAKGVDFLAQRIKKIAAENQVETIENKPLARSLYSQVEVGEEIPEEFFKVVAEILAKVYQIKKKV